MRGRYVILPAADADIDRQALYYAEEGGIDVAIQFLDAVRRTCEILAAHPRMGWPCRVRRAELATARVFRIVEFDKILVFYRPSKNRLEILRVLHGSRNLDPLFD